MAKTGGTKLIANNKKARHDYFVEETVEAGIVLFGTEVKSMRQGHCSIKEAFISIDNGEVFVKQMHISPYEKGNIFNKDPLRERKLLMHSSEITRMMSEVNRKGRSEEHTSELQSPLIISYAVDWDLIHKIGRASCRERVFRAV